MPSHGSHRAQLIVDLIDHPLRRPPTVCRITNRPPHYQIVGAQSYRLRRCRQAHVIVRSAPVRTNPRTHQSHVRSERSLYKPRLPPSTQSVRRNPPSASRVPRSRIQSSAVSSGRLNFAGDRLDNNGTMRNCGTTLVPRAFRPAASVWPVKNVIPALRQGHDPDAQIRRMVDKIRNRVLLMSPAIFPVDEANIPAVSDTIVAPGAAKPVAGLRVRPHPPPPQP